MLVLLLFTCYFQTDSAETLLMRARAERDPALLESRLFNPKSCSDLLLQEMILTLGQIGNSAAPAKIASFFDQPNLVDTALFAYGEVDGAPIEPLIPHVAAAQGSSRQLAFEALTKLASEAQREQVGKLWLDFGPVDRAQTAFFLWRVPSEPITTAVIAHLDTKPDANSGGFIYYLARAGQAVSSALKAKLLAHFQEEPRILQNVLRLKTSDQDRTGPEIAKLCRHEDALVRINAVRALVKADPTLVAGAANTMLGDANPGVVREAITALVGLGWENVDHTLANLTDGFSPSHLQTLTQVADKEQLPKFAPLLNGWLEAAPRWKNVQAIRALGRLKDEASRAKLVQLCADQDPIVRDAALGALGEAGEFPERAALLERAMASGESLQLASALTLATKDDAPKLLELARKTYTDVDFQYALFDQLPTWLGREAADAAFKTFLEHPDYLVRLKAFNLLGASAGSRDQVLAQHWTRQLPQGLLNEAASLLRRKEPLFWELQTNKGKVTIQLQADYAPITVANIMHLTRKGYFDHMTLHRVVPNFVVQAGDPRGDGSGGPGYAIPCEINLQRFGRGAVGMALAGKDTGGSQFFICHSPQPHLDGGYTVFGQVVVGMNVADLLEEGDVIERARLR